MPAQFSPRTMGPTSASGPRAARSAADLHRQPKRNALSHVSHHNTTYSCSSSTMGSNSPSINTSPSAASTHTSPSEHCNHAYPVAFCCLKDLQLNHSTPHQSTSHHCSPATGFTCEQKPLLKVLPRASISTEKPSTAQSETLCFISEPCDCPTPDDCPDPDCTASLSEECSDCDEECEARDCDDCCSVACGSESNCTVTMCHYDIETAQDQECGQSTCHYQLCNWLQRFDPSENAAPFTAALDSQIYTGGTTGELFSNLQMSEGSGSQYQGGLYAEPTYSEPYQFVVNQNCPTGVEYFTQPYETTSPPMPEEQTPQPWLLAQESSAPEQPQPNQAQPEALHSSGPRRPRLAPPMQPKVKDEHKFTPTKEMSVPEGIILSIGDEHFCSETGCEVTLPYTSKQSANEHWLSAHGGVRWKCLGCDREFGTPSGARRHYRSSHQGTKYPCPSCRKPQSSRSNLVRHQLKCKGPR